MAEQVARFRQYEYRATSNLVLTSDANRAARDEPSGEPETLVGKMSGTRMGDRVVFSKPRELEDSRKRRVDREAEAAKKKGRKGLSSGGLSVLQAADDLDVYQPRTKETRMAYESLLNEIASQLGDQPQDVLRGAADEVLACLKNDALTDPQRKREVESLLNAMAPECFAKLVDLGKRVTDYLVQDGSGDAGAKLDDELGVAVVFDDDDEELDGEEGGAMGAGYVDVEPEEDDEDDGAVQADADEADVFGLHGAAADEVTAGGGRATGELAASSIDAYWLQRQLAQHYEDALAAQKMSADVLGCLLDEDEREAENGLVSLLDYDKFDLIRLLLKHRFKIGCCTMLAQAQSDEARAEVRVAMMARAQTAAVVCELEAAQVRTDDVFNDTRALEQRIRKEAGELAKLQKGADGKEADPDSLPTAHKSGGGGGARVPSALDLELLKFEAGGHTMSNRQCALPAGSFRATHKGYEEVHVPALMAPPPGPDEKLVPFAELPTWAQPAFRGMDSLNRVQSRVYPFAMFESDNMLVCAPTGAGKTNVAMLAILHELGQHRARQQDEGVLSETDADGKPSVRVPLRLDEFKVVYIAPMKALVQEVVNNFSKRLAPYGVNVRELTGDAQLNKAQLADTQLIVTTPEKWDIVTRKSGERTYTQLVRLVIIDEIHLLHDERGAVLEAIIARILRQIETSLQMTRLVGISATLPNFDDVATLLRVRPDRGLFHFDNSYRPVPLHQQYIGITEKKAIKRFAMMNELCYEKTLAQAGSNQVLTLAVSRMCGCLAELLQYGFGIHHAGMAKADRQRVEELFDDGHVKVLVSTATLAWGVNLPAHTVIIKGTQVYNPEKGAWVELSQLDMMQMIGRAGRPQHDTEGEGIVLTTHGELQYYLSLLNQQLPIESQLVARLADQLNAEVVLGSVHSAKEGAEWLGYTYLFIRMLKNPSLYGISAEEAAGDELLEARRNDLIHSAATVLDRAGLVRYVRKTGAIQSTDLGRVAAHYYVSHETISLYNEYLKPTLTDIELFRLFSLSKEFAYMSVREEEKQELLKLVERVPVPIKEGIDEPSAKTNVLLQAHISNLKLEGFALAADMVYITQSASRLLRALHQIALTRGWAALGNKLLQTCIMVDRKMWLSQSPLRQFRTAKGEYALPEEVIRKLEKKDFPWERFYDLQPNEIAELVRLPKMGKPIHRLVHQFPRLELSAHVQPITRTVLRVELTITPDFEFDVRTHGGAEQFHILVEDVDGEGILHHELFVLKARFAQDEHVLTFTVPISDPLPPQYFIRAVSDRWLGAETVLPISFRHLILPEKYPPHTELLDLQPLPVAAVGAELAPLFEGRFTHFNPIQTQAFKSLFDSDDNALLGAPTGSGKTVCAELAIARMLTRFGRDAGARAIYIAPLEEIGAERYADWSVRLREGLGLRVTKLCGETASDLKLLEQGDVVIGTPAQWDQLTRRWKQRKLVQQVRLVLADELHLIGGEFGPTIEIVLSRFRYIGAQTDQPIRIVGLSTSLANARDLAEWLGAPAHALFNFHPSVRPVPLEVHIQGFEIAHAPQRLLAMSKPAYFALANHTSADQPGLLFVPSAKQAQLTAVDVLTFAKQDGNAERFLHLSAEELAPHLAKISDPAVRHFAERGVGVLHEHLPAAERLVVETLYAAGAISLCIVSQKLCWGLPLSAHVVVVLDTQFFDGAEHRYVDYSLTSMLQMMGRACRPQLDESGLCVILCQGSKKPFFKKFLHEALPVESHVHHFLHDHMCAEVVTKTIENKQDAVDYLTWTFMYRRLTQNPNYYNLTGASHRHLSDFLSELVETTLADLDHARCIQIDEDGVNVSPLNLGMIACYYSIGYTTLELFASSLQPATKLRGLLEILAAAPELSSVPVRHREDELLRALALHCPLKVEGGRYDEPSAKVNLLLQCHFSRKALPRDMAHDLRPIVEKSARLLQAMVDVVSSSGWLTPALACMELSQMVTQALWERDSPLMQLPHFTKELAAQCTAAGVEGIFDLMDLEDADRNKLLNLSLKQLADVARMCNRYPSVDVTYEVEDADEIASGDSVVINVALTREAEGAAQVHAPRFPKAKDEGWWLVVGDPANNILVSIKRVMLQQKAKVKLEFVAPAPGEHKYQLYFMCDSYLGCDQEYELKLAVGEAADDDEEDGSEEADE
ncbi:Sec63 Brl domain-containing protein [Pavlovales sp. CCMP2436]|nr:Sec63 Brl domain-containing protein [Pavlovales sp. CCMP2436]